MFEEELDSHGRNIKALCLWICVVPVKCLVHEASLIKVNYTLTLSHCKHSPSVSFSLPASLSLSVLYKHSIPAVRLCPPLCLMCLLRVSGGCFVFVCAGESPSSEPHLPPWTHSLPGPALWLVVSWRRHSPSSTPSSFHLHVQLLFGLPGEKPPLECALHRDPSHKSLCAV